MKKLWTWIVRLHGWKYDVPEKGTRPEIYHSVMIMAPHTAIADFFLGAGCIWKLGLNPRIFMKKEFFNCFTRGILTRLGVVAVDRGNTHNNLVPRAVECFAKNEKVTFVITPEGTRKKVLRWKRGFYEIAAEAKVPIVLTYIDFKTKTMGVGPTFYPTGDFHADLPKIMAYYHNIGPKHPEGWNVPKSLDELERQ